MARNSSERRMGRTFPKVFEKRAGDASGLKRKRTLIKN